GKSDLLLLLESFTAYVRRVISAVGGGDLRHLDDLFGLIRTAAFVASDQAPRSLLHGAGNELFHPLHFSGRGCAALVTEHHPADLLGRDMGDDVHRDALALEAIEISGEVHPVGGDTFGRPVFETVPRR